MILGFLLTISEIKNAKNNAVRYYESAILNSVKLWDNRVKGICYEKKDDKAVGIFLI